MSRPVEVGQRVVGIFVADTPLAATAPQQTADLTVVAVYRNGEIHAETRSGQRWRFGSDGRLVGGAWSYAGLEADGKRWMTPERYAERWRHA